MSLKTRIKQITPTQVLTATAVVAMGVVVGSSIYNMNDRTNAYKTTINGMSETYSKFLYDSLALNLKPSPHLPH